MHQSRRSTPRRLALALVLPCAVAAVTATLTGCASKEETFNPLASQRVARAHAGETPTVEMRPLPHTLQSDYLPSTTRPATGPAFAAATQPAPSARPTMRLSLQDLVKRAVAHNIDARVTAYQPAIDQARVVEANAAYDLKYFANFQFVNQDNLYPTANNPLSDPFRQNVLFRDLQLQTGLKQETTTGASIQLHYQADQFDRGGPGFAFTGTAASDALLRKQDPFWTNSLQLQVKQPLLQNFGAAANEARIAIARNTQKSSALDFRIQLEKSLAELEKDYWQLVQAEQDVHIRETLLQTTRGSAGIIKSRIGTTATTNTELSLANEAVRNREFDLVTAQGQVDKLSNTIKSLVNDPELPVSGGALILPADVPLDAPVKFNLEEQINTALAYRPELAQQQLKIRSAETTVEAARNNELPQFDIIGQIGFDGFAQQFDAAVRNQLRFDFVEYTLGFQFQVPIGNREARAITTRTQLQRLQAIWQYQGLVDKITAEVKNAQTDLEVSWNQIASARAWRVAAEEEVRLLSLDEKARPEGMSPSFVQTKLDAQLRVAEAQRQEITAMASYSANLALLEQAKGTLLRYDNVVLDEDTQPTVPLTWNKDGWKVWKK